MRALLNRLEQAGGLDRVGDRVQQSVQAVLRPQRVRDFLHGVWLGHPLHPAMVQVPLGAWISSAILDLMPEQRRASTVLVAVGTASALPSAVAGANDWAALSRDQRRVGLVHAATNVVATACYAASLVARLRGRHDIGKRLGFVGLAAASGGAYIGGHLAYKQAAQVNQAAPELHLISEGWHQIADLSALPQETLVTRQIDNVPVIVYRTADDITVMLEKCAHQGGPLGSGQLIHNNGHACVVCPWHGSTFELTGGEVVHGPAGTDQPLLPSRVTNGVLEARLP
jgi:nitrite reductase/ring-hydroxylating ferredoxin subunit